MREKLPTVDQEKLLSFEQGINYAIEFLVERGSLYAANALSLDYWGYPLDEDLALPTLTGDWARPSKPVHEYHSKSEAYANGVQVGFERGLKAQ